MLRGLAPESAFRYAACAWCGSVLDRATGELVGPGEAPSSEKLSHGMCGDCLAEELRRFLAASRAGTTAAWASCWRGDARTVATRVNQHVLEIARALHGDVEDGSSLVGLFCECGCLDTVMVTPEAYAARGALLPGHHPGGT